MERKLNNSVNMIRATLTFCTNNPTPTSGISAFAPAKATATSKLVLIDNLDQIVMGSSKGVTLDTNGLRTTMSDIAFKCGSAVSAFAASVNNNTLRAKVTYSRAAFNRFKKDEVDDVCQTIHDEADANIAAAGPFGYDATDVTDLQTAINLYRTAAQNPRQSIISKGQAIANIILLIREIIKNIFEKQMDKMVDTVLTTEPNFHKGYRLSRETINLGVTHAKVRGTIKDEGDFPLIGASFIIKTTGTNNIIAQTLTKAKGAYLINKIPAADYDFTWSFTNYQTLTETNVHISAGKEIKRNVVLQAALPPFIRQADVIASSIATINTTGLIAEDNSLVKIEVTGNTLRFYAAETINGAPGSVFLDVPVGTTTMLLSEFKTLIGADATKDFLNVQNNSASVAHYKLTFNA